MSTKRFLELHLFHLESSVKFNCQLTIKSFEFSPHLLPFTVIIVTLKQVVGEDIALDSKCLELDSEIQYQPIVQYEKQKKCIGSRGRGPRRTRLVFSLAVCDGSPCLRRSRLLASHFCLQLQDYGSLSPDTLPTSSRHFLRLDLASIRPV